MRRFGVHVFDRVAMLKSVAMRLPSFVANGMRCILRDRFFKIGTLLVVAGLITNLFNFLFQVTMGRMLDPTEYGTLNALLSLLMITIIPFSTIMMMLARQTSIYKVGQDLPSIRSLFDVSYRRLYGIGTAIFLVFLVVAPLVTSFLQLGTVTPVILLGLVSLLSMSYPINLAFLQGLQAFGFLALASGALGPLRYGFCVLLVLLGRGVDGVLFGLILCYLALFGLSIWPIYGVLRNVTVRDRIAPPSLARAFPEFMANLCFAFMTQFDLVIVKHLFKPDLTGTYAVAAVLGRAVMYLPVSLVLALFPMVTESHTLNRDPRPFLWKALSYTLLLSGTGALLCWLFPDLILGFLFGQKYLDASPLLRLYGMAMLPLALVLVLMNFVIAQGRTRIWLLLSLGAASEMGMILLLHSDLMHILVAVFVGGTFSLALCMYAAVRSSPITLPFPRDQIRSEEKSSQACH